jgi:TolB-like protein
MLLERPGEVVTREEIRQHLWTEETFVDFDNGLNAAINRLRNALGDSAEHPRYIETLPRRGYRLIVPVESIKSVAPLNQSAAPAREVPQEDSEHAAAFWFLLLRSWRASWRRGIPLVILLAAVAGYFALRHTLGHPKPRADRVMLAVLPFQNLTGDPQQEYFSDGVTEEMITQLGGMNPERLGVIARTSAMYYKGSAKTAGKIGNELGVDYLLEGSVRRSDTHARISVQLIRVLDQTHLWAQDYDRDLRDVLAVEAEVSESVANSIQVRLAPEGHVRFASARAVNPEAFDAYLRGRYLWNSRTIAGLEKSVEYFQEAIAKQSDYELAYAALADSYNILGNFGLMPPKKAYPQAKAAATRALEIDPSLAQAQTALSFAQFLFDWEWTAEDGFRRAIQLNPNYGPAHQWYGVILISRSRPAEAMAQETLAQQAEPYSLIIHSVKGWVAYLAHRYDDAVAASRQALELDANFSPAHCYLGLAYEAKGMYPEAIRELQKFARVSDRPFELGALAHAYAVAGRREEARQLITDFQRRALSGYFPAWYMAIAYAGMGDRDQAFQWLEKAYQERCPWLIHLRAEPRLESLHDDPRFDSLARRIGLPPSVSQ